MFLWLLDELKDDSLAWLPLSRVNSEKSRWAVGVSQNALCLSAEFNFELDMLGIGLPLPCKPFELTDLLLKLSGVVSSK